MDKTFISVVLIQMLLVHSEFYKVAVLNPSNKTLTCRHVELMNGTLPAPAYMFHDAPEGRSCSCQKILEILQDQG